jgi:molecular chaperone HtpG
VGKDILELLSSGMYVDARSVFRELIQNSADAIDEAFSAGLFRDGELARVDILFDQEHRTVRVRDNGIGVRASRAESVLTSFGASAKRGTNARGFRGVGRLAAFGYAQSVAFKTKAAGETVATEVRWDCRRLKSTLADPSYDGDLRRVVRDVVTVVNEEELDPDLHYFEVLLERVVRIKNDVLLNPDEVRDYLAQVAPAPFPKDFPFGDAIANRLAEHVPPPPFRIFIDRKEHICRPHFAELSISHGHRSVPTDVQFINLPDGEGGTRAVIWLLHHSYFGAFRSDSFVRGLRARVGDMQVGDADVFAKAFPEPRFNSWTIGEVHVVDRRIIPNARRDGFEQNAAYTDLEAQLVPLGREIARRCRKSSARRNRARAFELRAQQLRTLFDVLTQRGIPRSRELRTRRDIGVLFGEIKRIAQSGILTRDERHRLRRQLVALTTEYEGLRTLIGASDVLAGFPQPRRAAYQHTIDLIYECAPNKTVARVLVDRILDQLAALSMPASRRKRQRRRSVDS